jgi:hypothetical protein
LSGNQISNARIGSISADKIKTGTLTIGGSTVGAPKISVKDINDVEKVTIDEDGILVQDGNITIQDENGTSVIDSLGINSTNAFTSSSITTGAQIVTSTTYIDITGSNVNINFARTTKVLFLLTTEAYLVETPFTDTCNGYIQIYEDSIGLEGLILNSGNNQNKTISTHQIRDVSAGTKTFKLMTKISIFGGSPSMTIDRTRFTILELGK